MCHLLKGCRFLFKKINMSVFSGFRLLLKLLTIKPAVEKIRSDGTEVAGTHSSLRASFVIIGNLSWLDFHHTNAHSSWCN